MLEPTARESATPLRLGHAKVLEKVAHKLQERLQSIGRPKDSLRFSGLALQHEPSSKLPDL